MAPLLASEPSKGSSSTIVFVVVLAVTWLPFALPASLTSEFCVVTVPVESKMSGPVAELFHATMVLTIGMAASS